MLGDTIFAVASPPGSSARAVLRLSGPAARSAASAVFSPLLPPARCVVDGVLTIASAPIAAMAISMPSPHSYTGEDVVELHVPGSPVLCAWIHERLAAASPGSVRTAMPGEFTARAVQNGKLDLARAEGVHLLIHAEAVAEAARGAEWLRGGLSAAVALARTRLQDALALLEVGLDFESEETGAVPDHLVHEALAEASRSLAELEATLPVARRGGEFLLLGRSNAGKSTLANALAGRAAVLVDAAPGTTRDVVRVELANGAVLLDGPGDLDRPSELDRQALLARDRFAQHVAGVVCVVDPDDVPSCEVSAPLPQVPVVALVFTKADRREPSLREIHERRSSLRLADGVPHFVVSSRTGAGLAGLLACLAPMPLRNELPRTSPGTGRLPLSSTPVVRDACGSVRIAVQSARAATARALVAPAPELAAKDLQDALEHLATVDGSHGVDDLLDRIYGRFCLGK